MRTRLPREGARWGDDPIPLDPRLRSARENIYDLLRRRPAAVSELRPELVSTYGSVLVDKAVRVYRRFERQDPDAKIVQNGPFSFAQEVLAQAHDNEAYIKLSSEHASVFDYLESMEKNTEEWVKAIREAGSIKYVWYGGTNRSRTLAGLLRAKEENRLTAIEAFHLYFISDRHPWIKLFGIIAFAALLQRAFRSYMFDQGVKLFIGSTNLVVVGTLLSTFAIVFLIMTKISGSPWVASGAVTLLVFVINLLMSWWPIS